MGEEIIRQAKVVLFNSSQMKEFVLSGKQQEAGSLRMGIAPTVAPYILPRLLHTLCGQHPGISLRVEEAQMATLTQKLERAELDVALIPGPTSHTELLEIPLYRETFVAYVSPQDELYPQDELLTSVLPTNRMWVLRDGYCPNQDTFPFCHCQQGKANIYQAGSIETLVRIVDENGGLTIIPALHVPLLCEAQQRHVRKLYSPEPHRIISLVIRKDYVRERLLNILADAIKGIVPEEMVEERMRKYRIKL